MHAAPTGTAACHGSRITIDEPANGAVVDIAAPITVRGPGEGLPEGNVVVEALDGAGNVLTTQPTTVTASDAGTGGAGPWSVQLTVDVPSGTAGSIRAFSPSPADGSILADVSVAVIYGEAPPPAQASITIDIPLARRDHQRPAGRRRRPGHGLAGEQRRRAGAGRRRRSPRASSPRVEAEARRARRMARDARLRSDAGHAGQIYAFSTSPADGSIMAEARVDIRFGAVAQPAITIDAAAERRRRGPGGDCRERHGYGPAGEQRRRARAGRRRQRAGRAAHGRQRRGRRQRPVERDAGRGCAGRHAGPHRRFLALARGRFHPGRGRRRHPVRRGDAARRYDLANRRAARSWTRRGSW